MGLRPSLTVLSSICCSSLSFPSTLLILHPWGFHSPLKDATASIFSLGFVHLLVFSHVSINIANFIKSYVLFFFFEAVSNPELLTPAFTS